MVERERELTAVRKELADLHAAREAGGDAGVEEALRRLESQVEEIWAQARGQATRIRMQALRQAARLAPRPNGADQAPSLPEGSSVVSEPSAESGMPAPSAGERPPGWAVEVFEGLVHLEVGPLDDFSQLVRFEDAVSGLGAASEISVKRFSRGRATLAVRLDRPVELLRELEERSPFELKVRSLKDDRLVVDVNER